MRITVLGKSPSWQDAGGACSGYLIEQGQERLLLDCGSGVFAKLRAACDYATIGTVVLSHLHADHLLDLVPFSYALRFGSHPPVRPRLYAPSGSAAALRQLTGSWGSEDLIEAAFALQEYDAPDVIEVGPFTVRFCPVPHFTPTYAVEVSAGGGRITFGADCGPNDEVVRFARDTDLLLIEATLTDPEPEGERGHLTPAEAGEHARKARVTRVVLTHYSDEVDPDWVRAEAQRAFGASVELAAEGASYVV